jgi:hypothetical protein
MNKRAYSGRLVLIVVLIIFLNIAAGCTGVGNRQNNESSSPDESMPVHPTGLIQTPVTPGTTLAGNNYPGVSPLITPNESNSGPDYIHPPIPDMWTDPFPREDVSRLLYIPMYLPEGFSYGGGSYASNGVVWLRISNSSTNVIYIQTPESGDPGISLEGEGVQIQQIFANDQNYTYKMSGTEHQLSWNRDDLDFYLTGEPGPDELFLMAGSIEPVSDESLRQLFME